MSWRTRLAMRGAPSSPVDSGPEQSAVFEGRGRAMAFMSCRSGSGPSDDIVACIRARRSR
jgi:hypothetical protein